MGMDDVLPPPNSATVEGERRVVLYDHSGRPLVRMIGFQPEVSMQTRGTFKELHDSRRPKPKAKPKGGK